MSERERKCLDDGIDSQHTRQSNQTIQLQTHTINSKLRIAKHFYAYLPWLLNPKPLLLCDQ